MLKLPGITGFFKNKFSKVSKGKPKVANKISFKGSKMKKIRFK